MPFHFNFYSSLLLIPFIQGVLYVLLLLFRWRRESRISDLFLSAVILINTITVAFWMLGYAGWYDTHDGFTSFMFYFPFNNYILLGPALYFYFLSVTNSSFSFQKHHRKHMVLPMLWLLFILFKGILDYIFNAPFPATEEFQFGTRGPLAQLDKTNAIAVISFAVFFYYITLTLKKFRLYRTYITSQFSSMENIEFNWLRNILYAILAGGSILFLFFSISFISGGLSFSQHWYSYLLIGLLIFYISINGYATHNLPQLHFIPEVEEKVIDITAVVEDPDLAQQKILLMEHILKDKLYLNPELSLNELSKSFGTNTTYLSRLINQGYDQNFNDFINGLRVKAVEEAIANGMHKQRTLLSIAFDCGFNSKTTFNRAFKKVHQLSPADYIKSVNQ